MSQSQSRKTPSILNYIECGLTFSDLVTWLGYFITNRGHSVKWLAWRTGIKTGAYLGARSINRLRCTPTCTDFCQYCRCLQFIFRVNELNKSGQRWNAVMQVTLQINNTPIARVVVILVLVPKKYSGTARRDKRSLKRLRFKTGLATWNRSISPWVLLPIVVFNKSIWNIFLTCRVKLNKLQILAGQPSSGHHCISISCTSVSRCATEIGSSITPERKDLVGFP